MKKLILLYFILINAVFAKAQQYVPFPTNNAEWTVLRFFQADDGTNTGGQGTPVDTSMYQIKVTGEDTIIGGNIYHKIYSKQSYPNPGVYTYSGAFRELNKFILYRSAELTTTPCSPLNQDDTVYNFNAIQNDLVKATSGSCNKANVVSVDSININGIYRRRLNVGGNAFLYNGSNNVNQNEYWIEGIGSTVNPFTRFIPIALCNCHEGYEMACFKLNGATIYSSPVMSVCNGAPLHIPIQADTPIIPKMPLPQGLENICIYPNPTIFQELHINNVDTKYELSIKLTDYTGKTIHSQKLNHTDNVIRLPRSGQLYLLMILDYQGNIVKVQKVFSQ